MRLFADAELGEYGAQDLFHVDYTGQAPQMMRGEAELLRGQFRRKIMVNKSFQSIPG